MASRKLPLACCFLVELPGIETEARPGKMSVELPVRSVSVRFSTSRFPCTGLFCFIGARPATEWLSDLALDRTGFIRTDAQLDPEELGATWTALGRAPLPFETSMPTVFAAGDVRLNSLKRVASAVGEGASAVRSIHTALGPQT